MESLRFDIRHADGRHETTTAQASRIVIGSGAHCDVRLAADQAAFEHVTIEDDPSGPMMRSLPAVPVVLVDGAPFASQLLAAVTVLRVGASEVQISRAVLVAASAGNAMGPAMIAKLGVVALLAVAIFAASRSSSEPAIAAPPKAPSLFAPAATDCPRVDESEARVVADDQRAIADGARERSPFDPREVRSAVKSYELAAACYRVAQRRSDSDEATQSAQRMRDDTLLDFRARRIRLERVLLVKDYEVASQDVAVLRALTEGGQADEYSRWLASVSREIKNQKVENK